MAYMTPMSVQKRRELPEAMDIASNEVEYHMQNDMKFPSLEQQLKLNASPSFSGMNDFDYPANANDKVNQKLATVKKVPLPDELACQFTNMQCNCVMGVFPEISRAWLAIDSDIYFWMYEDGSDVAFFDGIKEVILAASLIPPKPGVFQDHIMYLLCITTPINIYLLGVSFTEKNVGLSGDAYGAIQLHPEPLFTVGSDNIYMNTICSTINGRIFLAGKDSSLYELVYQVKSSWLFSQKCYKVNHSSSKLSFFIPTFLSFVFSSNDPIDQLAVDNSRGILYCRTVNGNIKAYSLGADLTEMHFMSGISSSNASRHAQYVVRTADQRNFESIVHIAPVPKTDSSCVHLIAITSTGARLYFATSADIYGAPSNLRLVHVRMPPGFAPSLPPEKPLNIHAAFYRQGTSIMIGAVSETVDRLWCLSQDMFPFNTAIKETQSVVSIDGRLWCLSEIPDYASSSTIPFHLFNDASFDLPAILTQHVLPPRRFVLLSAQGSHIVTTLRPLEKLCMLLSEGNVETQAVANFFQQYGTDQACAVCIALLCQAKESDLYVSDLAVQAYFRYGGNILKHSSNVPATIGPSHPMSSYIVGSPAQGGSSDGSFLSTPVHQGYHQQVPTPAPPNLMSSTIAQPPIPHHDGRSGKYNGLVLHFARIVRPLWNQPMVYHVSIDEQKSQLQSRLSSTELAWFTEQLYSVKKFMDAYSDVGVSQTQTYIHRYSLLSEDTSVNQEACLEEKKCLKAFYHLLVITLEALELWRVLTDHQFHLVVEDAPTDIKEKLNHTPVKDLFSPTGRELSLCLINLLMEKYLHDNTAIENLSARLRGICPTIFSANDALCTKANEIVIAASHVHNQKEKEKIFHEALAIYSKIPDLIDLKWVTENFKASHFYNGIVQLSLTAALNRDPMGVALHYYKSGEPHDDLEGVEAFATRMESYSCILETLEELLRIATSHPASPNLPTRPGPPVHTGTISGELAKKYYDQMLANGLTSGDELFHVALYAWLMKSNQPDRLLDIKSLFLEQYLVALATEQHPNNKETLDVLWKYYEKNNNFLAASKVLAKLAEREGSILTIHNRMESLSRAVMSAKSISTAHVYEGEFLHELEEKLDVARVQLQIHERLSQKKVRTRDIDNDLLKLNSKLFDISMLYGDFAERHDLPICKLSIIHCAGHTDYKLVQKIWREIIEQAFDGSRHLSANDKMQSVGKQLIHDGHQYVTFEQYFPTGYIVSMLERKSCEMNWKHSWVFTTLLEMGVDAFKLFKEYKLLFSAKDHTWKVLGQPLHLLHVISLLLLHLLELPPRINTERISFTRTLYEATTSFLVEIEALDISNTQVKSLLSTYKFIQAKLKRAI